MNRRSEPTGSRLSRSSSKPSSLRHEPCRPRRHYWCDGAASPSLAMSLDFSELPRQSRRHAIQVSSTCAPIWRDAMFAGLYSFVMPRTEFCFNAAPGIQFCGLRKLRAPGCKKFCVYLWKIRRTCKISSVESRLACGIRRRKTSRSRFNKPVLCIFLR